MLPTPERCNDSIIVGNGNAASTDAHMQASPSEERNYVSWAGLKGCTEGTMRFGFGPSSSQKSGSLSAEKRRNEARVCERVSSRDASYA